MVVVEKVEEKKEEEEMEEEKEDKDRPLTILIPRSSPVFQEPEIQLTQALAARALLGLHLPTNPPTISPDMTSSPTMVASLLSPTSLKLRDNLSPTSPNLHLPTSPTT